MNAYNSLLEQLDKLQISPNRLVTLRTLTAISIAGILSYERDMSFVSQLSIAQIFLLSLLADKVDGDLARYTNQCSKEGEVLDAGADKVVVYGGLGLLLSTHFHNFSPTEIMVLGSLFGINLGLDITSQINRGWEANKDALRDFWKAPTSEEERRVYKYSKTRNGANIIGKLKTGTIMTALGVGIMQNIVGYSDDTLYTLLVSGMTVSGILSGASLFKKHQQKKQIS